MTTTKKPNQWRMVAAIGALTASCGAAFGGTFFADFNDGAVPPGTAVHGNTVVTTTGGVDNSGVLKLTQAVNGVSGAFVIEDLDPGALQGMNSFTASFKLRLGGGTTTPADGFSFCVGNDLPGAPWGEEGPTTTGLVVAFDIYDNGGGEAPAIDLRWAGAEFRHTVVPISFLRTGAGYADVMIKIDPDGTLDLSYNGSLVYSNVFVPNFQPMGAPKFGFGGRTGGLNENQWIDDLSISTTVGGLELAVTQQPGDLTVVAGSHATLRAAVNSLDPFLTLQWAKKGPGETDFTDIFNGFEATLVTDPLTLADSGTQYRLTIVGDIEVQTRVATVTVVDLSPPGAPTASYDFQDGAVPAGAAVFGTAVVGFDGFLHLTEAANDQNGAFVIDDLNGGQAVDSLYASFKLQLGPGTETPADGFSFNWANDLPGATIGNAEEGAGTGLTITFDVYDNGGAEAPSVDVKYGGAVIASRKLTIPEIALARFADVTIRLQSSGKIDVAYDGILLHQDVQLPGFTAIGGGKFGFAARTGGANEAHYVDDISLTTTLFTGPVTFTKQPADAVTLVGSTATFTIEVNDPARSSYQWQKRGPADGGFTDIAGANAASYTTPATVAEDNGTLFRCVATGPQNSVTSDEAVLNVANVERPAVADVSYDFNDGATPAGTVIAGNAFVSANGGVGDSGVLHLTDAVNDQNGAFIVPDLDGGQAVGSFTVAFRMRVGGGSDVPADGFSFNWATDLPAALPAEPENGAGTGLSVGFDIYDNGAAEAPAIELRWGGAVIASRLVPIDFIRTGDEFAEVLVKVNPNGTVTVAYEGNIVFYNVPLGNFSGLGGASFAWGARTGGLNENQWVDDIAIDTDLYVGPVLLTQQPASQAILNGRAATITAAVNDPARAALQWQSKGPGISDFENIAVATAASYVTPALGLVDSGTQFRVIVSSAVNVVTSDVATITVFNLDLPANHVDFTFDDGAVPPGGAVFGSASVSTVDGVNGSGTMKITIAANDQTGAFILNDQSGGASIDALTVFFKARVGEGTALPADGFSFAWASDLADGAFGEDGAGSGLVVSFDTWDNGGGEAPAIDVRYNGEPVASKKVPASLLDTGGDYVPVFVRVEPDGTVDVVYDYEVVIYNALIPNFTGQAGGRFAWGARTGGANENHWIDDIQISASTAPRISSIVRNGNAVTITYTGVLQSAVTVDGPYTDVNSASSPAVVSLENGHMFFRTRAEAQ